MPPDFRWHFSFQKAAQIKNLIFFAQVAVSLFPELCDGMGAFSGIADPDKGVADAAEFHGILLFKVSFVIHKVIGHAVAVAGQSAGGHSSVVVPYGQLDRRIAQPVRNVQVFIHGMEERVPALIHAHQQNLGVLFVELAETAAFGSRGFGEGLLRQTSARVRLL